MRKFSFNVCIILLFNCLTSCFCYSVETENEEIIVSSSSIQLEIENEEIIIPGNEISGTGVLNYTDYTPFADRSINVFYHIPKITNKNTPIVFVFHGNSRNGKGYRDAAILKANEYGFVVITPEFSKEKFTGSDLYNLGNVFEDGDNPSINTLNPEEEWTFSVIEPIFEYFKKSIKNTSTTYDIFGHSAGSQFAHRYLLFKPKANVKKTILSAAGWYTVPTKSIEFPYGVGKTPIENNTFASFCNKDIIVQVGALDNDNNASSLRNNSIVDQQGLNRVARATHFFSEMTRIAGKNNTILNWEFVVNPGLTHSYRPAVEKGLDLLFN